MVQKELTFIDNIVVPQILIKHIISNKITFLIRGLEYQFYVHIKWNIYHKHCLLRFLEVQTCKQCFLNYCPWWQKLDSFQPFSDEPNFQIHVNILRESVYWSTKIGFLSALFRWTEFSYRYIARKCVLVNVLLIKCIFIIVCLNFMYCDTLKNIY